MTELIETKEKYIVHWRLDGKNHEEECETLEDAQRLRWNVIGFHQFTKEEVSIHLIQINKFGDKVTVEN